MLEWFNKVYVIKTIFRFRLYDALRRNCFCLAKHKPPPVFPFGLGPEVQPIGVTLPQLPSDV